MSVVRTTSGLRVNILNPDPRTIDIRDIAVHLSNIPRFTGATDWSVLAHCMLVMNLAAGLRTTPYQRLWSMLHDGHEAYTGDITTPMKEVLGAERIKEIQDGLDVAIRTALGIGAYHNRNAETVARMMDAKAYAIELALLFGDNSAIDAAGLEIDPSLADAIARAREYTKDQWREKFIARYAEFLDDILEHRPPEGVLI